MLIEPASAVSPVARAAKQAVRAGWEVSVDHTEGYRMGSSGETLAYEAEAWTLRGRREGYGRFVVMWVRDSGKEKVTRLMGYAWGAHNPVLTHVNSKTLTAFWKEGEDALG